MPGLNRQRKPDRSSQWMCWEKMQERRGHGGRGECKASGTASELGKTGGGLKGGKRAVHAAPQGECWHYGQRDWESSAGERGRPRAGWELRGSPPLPSACLPLTQLCQIRDLHNVHESPGVWSSGLRLTFIAWPLPFRPSDTQTLPFRPSHTQTLPFRLSHLPENHTLAYWGHFGGPAPSNLWPLLPPSKTLPTLFNCWENWDSKRWSNFWKHVRQV